MLTVSGASENIKLELNHLLSLTQKHYNSSFLYCLKSNLVYYNVYCSLCISQIHLVLLIWNPINHLLPFLSLLLPSLSVFSLANRIANPSPMNRLALGSSHGPNLVIQHIPPSIKPCTPPSFCLSFPLHSLSHFPFLLLSNCQAAPGPARHLRHRLLILLDHRKKHVCLWNVRAFLDCDYIAAECVCVCVCVTLRIYWRVFPREVIFSPVMNPDGENLFLYPLLLLSSSPSGSDSGVRLCFLLALWFMVVMIYCFWAAWRQLQVPLLLLSLLLASLSLHVYSQALHLLSLSVSVCGVTVKLIEHTRPIMALKTGLQRHSPGIWGTWYNCLNTSISFVQQWWTIGSDSSSLVAVLWNLKIDAIKSLLKSNTGRLNQSKFISTCLFVLLSDCRALDHHHLQAL